MGDWGIGNFITFILVFIIIILVVIYNAGKIGMHSNITKANGDVIHTPDSNANTNNNNQKPTAATSYTSLETTTETAAKAYVAKYYPNISAGDKFVIKVSSLVTDGDMASIKDIKNSSITCSGYAIVYNDEYGAGITYKAYIKCGKNYETTGYLARYEE